MKNKLTKQRGFVQLAMVLIILIIVASGMGVVVASKSEKLAIKLPKFKKEEIFKKVGFNLGSEIESTNSAGIKKQEEEEGERKKEDANQIPSLEKELDSLDFDSLDTELVEINLD